MWPLTCDVIAVTERTPICHSLSYRVYLHIRGLTCGDAELTLQGATGMVRLAPSSRGDRRERAGRAAGTPQGGPDARDPAGSARIRRGPRPSEKGASPDPAASQGTPQGEPGGGSAGNGTPRGDPQPAKAEGSRKANRRRRSGSRAKNAEVAWGTRARGAEGGWELRFPTSRRSLGFSLFHHSSPTSHPARSARGLFSASVLGP